ncbi:hypothetical protein [Novipirellula artificiosorum]|uniref:RNA polymerase sigma factor n=1 Tax=Novipirellula artificiosorum TaxID=2528016 RepID=A0A5C6E407_9BACT|nr:hypothetical protein [Novipirellula artificiosorum]TWU42176.1 hypothetical protein Poly41_04720 [Novipirellula artificiosorum]
MANDTPPTGNRTTSVNLVRSSNPWTSANSAAGFVLRYLIVVRKQLIAVLGSSERADECLKILIAHLVSVGFGEHKKGRLRDFLIRAIRTTAKARISDLTVSERPTTDIDSVLSDNEQWLSLWRTGLLERAWRSLERKEHIDPQRPLFSVLHCATTKPKQPGQSLRERLKSERGVELGEADIQSLLPVARASFAQLLADEVAETLEKPTKEDVKAELKTLGLTKAFDGMSI